MRRRIFFGLTIVGALAATGCLPVTSKSPIGTTIAAKADPLLTGVWRGRVGSAAGPAYFTFIPQSDGSIQVVVVSPPAPGEEGGWDVFAVRSATLGPYRYLDAREIDDGGKPPDTKLAHIPVLYQIGADGSLLLYLMDDEAAKGAIKSGEIAGIIEPGQFGDVTLTAPPASLDAFLQTSAGRALFTKPFVTLELVE